MKPNPNSASEREAAWWREPYVWLVVGGPLVVVVAGIVTFVLAVNGADPVLERRADGGPRISVATQERSQLPAQLGRNHAATPVQGN